MDNSTKEKIKELVNDGNYTAVYTMYGAKAYKKYVPSNIKKEELRELTRERKL